MRTTAAPDEHHRKVVSTYRPLSDRLMNIVDALSNPDDYERGGKYGNYEDLSLCRAGYRRAVRSFLSKKGENPDTISQEALKHYEKAVKDFAEDAAIPARNFADRVEALLSEINTSDLTLEKGEEQTKPLHIQFPENY